MGALIYNNVNLSNLAACKIAPPVMPPVEIQTRDIAGAHGAAFSAARLMPRVISVDLYLRYNHKEDEAAIRRQLARALWSSAPAPLILPDDDSTYYLALVDGDSAMDVVASRPGHVSVNFTCPDPLGYSMQSHRVDLSSGTGVSVTTAGSWSAALTAEVTADSSGTAWLEINERRVTWSTSAGASYFIDCNNEAVYAAGSEVGVLPGSRWPRLMGTGSAAAGGCSSATLIYRDRWL